MVKTCRIGVVIPCYKVARFAGDAVASVREQTYTNWRLVVVDDGSPDDVWSAVRRHVEADARVRYVRTENHGVCAARNRGLEELGEEVERVMFLDGDDRLSAKALERFAREFEAFPEAAFVHCEPRIVDEAGAERPVQRWMPRWVSAGRFWARTLAAEAHDETPFESIYVVSGAIPSLCVYRRSAIVEAFDENIGQTGEDTDFSIAAALRGSVRHVPERLVDYRVHAGQCSRDEARFVRKMPLVYAKWTLRTDLPADWRERIVRAERFRRGGLRLRVALISGKRALRERRSRVFAKACIELAQGVASGLFGGLLWR